MNYKPLVLEKIREYSEMPEFAGYSVGEILYSIFAQMEGNVEFRKSTLLEVSDMEIYTMIEKAIIFEHQPEEKKENE